MIFGLNPINEPGSRGGDPRFEPVNESVLGERTWGKYMYLYVCLSLFLDLCILFLIVLLHGISFIGTSVRWNLCYMDLCYIASLFRDYVCSLRFGFILIL